MNLRARKPTAFEALGTSGAGSTEMEATISFDETIKYACSPFYLLTSSKGSVL